MIFSVKNTYSRTKVAVVAFLREAGGCVCFVGFVCMFVCLTGGERCKPRGVSACESLRDEG